MASLIGKTHNRQKSKTKRLELTKLKSLSSVLNKSEKQLDFTEMTKDIVNTRPQLNKEITSQSHVIDQNDDDDFWEEKDELVNNGSPS
jgi:hypothetical protein